MPGPRLSGLNEAVGRALRKASLEGRGEEALLLGQKLGHSAACSNAGYRKLPNTHEGPAQEVSTQNLKPPAALLLPLVIKCGRRETN